MANDRHTARIAMKVNIGNYETIDIEYGYESDAQSGEGPEDAHKRVKDFVDEAVKVDVAEVRSQVKKARNKGGY